MSHCLDPPSPSPDRHLPKMPWSSWTRWVLIGGRSDAYAWIEMRTPRTMQRGLWKVGKVWSDVISDVFSHKMIWLEFRNPKSCWKPGESAKSVRQSIRMLLTSFVSTVKRVWTYQIWLFSTGESPGPCCRIALMQKIELSRTLLCGEILSEVLWNSFCIIPHCNIPLLSVSPRKVIRKCNYANDITSPLKSQFMYLLICWQKWRKLLSHFCQELPDCLMYSYNQN